MMLLMMIMTVHDHDECWFKNFYYQNNVHQQFTTPFDLLQIRSDDAHESDDDTAGDNANDTNDDAHDDADADVDDDVDKDNDNDADNK